MQHTVDSLYEKIKDIQTKKEFLEEIKNIQNEYDGLFDDETAALLIVDKHGKNQDSITKTNDLEPGMECTIKGTITNIGEVRTFNKKNGSTGSVVNLDISDDAGTCNLVLWHNDVELVENKTIQKGTTVKIINGYVKSGYNGGNEINVGSWGLLEILSGEKNELPETEKDNTISGTIIDMKPSKAFFKDDGTFGFVTNITVKTKDAAKNVTLWDENVKKIQEYKVGDIIKIEDINIKEKNGKTEFHLNGNGKITKS